MRARVFVGSSTESLPVANGVRANLESRFEVRTWEDDLFEPGDFNLEALESFTRQFDAAVLVLGNDDLIISRGNSLPGPRDNVILEAGMFYGALGRRRVFLLTADPKSAEESLKLPSDLLGMSVLHYQEPSDGNYRAATATACHRIARRLEELTLRGLVHPSVAPVVLPVATFDSLQAARESIRAELKTCTDLKILANKGLQLFGLDDSVISMADLEHYENLRKIRVVLMDERSPWITEGLATLRRYESRESYVAELEVQHAIAESAMKRACSERSLHKSGIRYHRNEPYFRIIMTENVAFVSSYADPPVVQVRDLPVFAIRSEPGGLYGAIKRHFNDLWHNHSRPGKYLSDTEIAEESAGGMVYWLDREEVPWIALVKRHDGSWVLPKGHREVGDGDLELTAIREISEETGLQSVQLNVLKLLGVYTASEPNTLEGEAKKVVHIFLVCYESPERSRLTADADHPDAGWWRLDRKLPYLLYGAQRTLIADTALKEFNIDVQFE